MRVFYEGYIHSRRGQPYGGIARYFQQIIQRMPHDMSATVSLDRDLMALPPSGAPLRVNRYRLDDFRPWKLMSRLQPLALRFHPMWTPADVHHPTYYLGLSGRAVRQRGKPLVITIWDMIHEKFPELDPTGQIVVKKEKAIRQADALVAISEHTKQDAVELLSIPPERIVVTHLAPTPVHLQSEEVKPEQSSNPYFLFVGYRANRYKNCERLLSAFERVHSQHPEVRLVFAGSERNDFDDSALQGNKAVSAIEFVTAPTDEDLVALYRGCIAFIYPSLYEGFGIPPLEAMSAGAPVICSNASCLPEVVENAALLFDPYNEEALANCMSQILTDASLRDELIRRGYKQSAKFSWDKCAQKTFELYRGLL